VLPKVVTLDQKGDALPFKAITQTDQKKLLHRRAQELFWLQKKANFHFISSSAIRS
jgi:hypothetical protein